MRIIYLKLIILLNLFFSLSVFAQLQIEIAGVGGQKIPITVANFSGDENILLTNIIRNDLARSAYFRLVETNLVMSEASREQTSAFRTQGADALVVGTMQKDASGLYSVRYQLWDTIKANTLSALTISSSNPRLLAHRIADDIFEKLTGIKGVFSTRIAYITQVGKQYRLEVADSDGEGRAIALSSSNPIISPAWSPDGNKVAYVSFEDQKPVVYVQNLITRQRIAVAKFKGSNSAPTWSPDGKKLAVALAMDGLTQIYLINADGSGLQRLTQSSGIDTEPQFSPDGQSIYFTSDRSGNPQIYRKNLSDDLRTAQRITFNGSYNISPRISPDGKSLAFISRRNGQFSVYLMELASQQERKLTDTINDEAPSFAPNGQFVLYATGINGRGVLGMASVDGRVKQRIKIPVGDVREPTWGPLSP